MPFIPELFSGPALARFYDKKRRDELEAVPYFDGLMAGEPSGELAAVRIYDDVAPPVAVSE